MLPDASPTKTDDAFEALFRDAVTWHKKRGGTVPQSDLALFAVVYEYWRRLEDVWVPGRLTALSKNPAFNKLWRTVRLLCLRCDDGYSYFVVRHRLDRAFKIAGCTNYHDTGCEAVMPSKEYSRTKGNLILALLLEQPAPQPYITVPESSRRNPRAGGSQSLRRIP